jgi:DNA-binding protein HU-beta
MNRKELIDAIADKVESGASKKLIKEVTDAFLETVKENVHKGEKISLVGFGTFYLAERKARNGINPQTKKKIKIPAAKVPKFKASKKF